MCTGSSCVKTFTCVMLKADSANSLSWKVVLRNTDVLTIHENPKPSPLIALNWQEHRGAKIEVKNLALINCRLDGSQSNGPVD